MSDPQPPNLPKKRKTGRPPGPCSPAELAQRRAASKLGAAAATGPRTLEGKARCTRNAWKTGEHSAIHKASFDNGMRSLMSATGKPCLSTCPKYPCELVDDGMTRPGGTCLDKAVYVQAFGAIIDAVQNGSMAGINGIMAAEVSAALQLLHDLRAQIAEQGMVVAVPAINADGQVIRRADGTEVVAKMIANPGFGMVMKTLETLGISLPELLATPQAQSRAKVETEKVDAMQTLVGGIYQRAGRPTIPARVIEHDDGA